MTSPYAKLQAIGEAVDAGLVSPEEGARVLGYHTRSKKSRDDFVTPGHLLERVRFVGPIVLDPCTSPANPVAAEHTLTKQENGLLEEWAPYLEGEEGLAYVNSEYGRALQRWCRKVVLEAHAGVEIVQLTPARPDTRWFHEHWSEASAVCFLRGRLTFIDPDTGKPYASKKTGEPQPAGFPSMLWYFGDARRRFVNAFRSAGIVEVLR